LKLSSNFFQKGDWGTPPKIKLEILAFVSERCILFTESVYTLAKFTKDTNPLFWAFRVDSSLKG
jgi:hypothetical protein